MSKATENCPKVFKIANALKICMSFNIDRKITLKGDPLFSWLFECKITSFELLEIDFSPNEILRNRSLCIDLK